VIRAPARPAPGPQAYRRAVTVPSGRQLAACAVIGAAMLAGGNGGVSWAERRVPSGLAALLVASVPLWMLLTDRVVTRAAPSRSALLALAIGFAGVGVLARLGSHPGETAGVVVVLCASVSWAVGSLLGRWLPQPARPLVATAFQMLAGGAVLALAAAISGEAAHFDPGTVSVRSWLALAYLIGPGSVLALTCFTVALRQLPTATVATYAYVNPVVAVTLGWAVLGEKVSTLTLVGGALIVAAVALVVRGRNHAH
jgi:drug/metabolite transporter (DMT)-like permease